MPAASEAIGSWLSWEGPFLLEEALYSTSDGRLIGEAVSAWCDAHLGAAVAAYRFYRSSVSSVHGVDLADGRAVVVRVSRTEAAGDRLAGIVAAQLALADAGYPCPRPLAGPAPLGAGVATAEACLDAGRPPDPNRRRDRRRPGGRRALAAWLRRDR